MFLSASSQYKVSTTTWLLFVPEWHFNICIKHFTQPAGALRVLDRLNVIFSSRTDRFGSSGRGPFCCCSRIPTLRAALPVQLTAVGWQSQPAKSSSSSPAPTEPSLLSPRRSNPLFSGYLTLQPQEGFVQHCPANTLNIQFAVALSKAAIRLFSFSVLVQFHLEFT